MKRLIHHSLRSPASLFLAGIFAIAGVGHFMVVPQSAAPLATFVVNSTLDLPDLVPGDGLCNTNVATCTLRAAIMESNFSGGANVITVPAGTYTLSLGPADDEFNAAGATMESGDLDIIDLSAFGQSALTSVTINGAGAGVTIIDGGDIDRVLDINNFAAFGASVDVTLNGLTIRNGNAPTSSGFNESGGGIQFDGFNNQTFLPAGTLTINNCNITSNTAAGQGGGILAIFGSLDMDGSEVSGNTATNGAGGGISYDGSSAAGLRTLEITNSKISGNQANHSTFGNGGGMWEGGNADKTITHNAITLNSAGAHGGGVFNGSGGLSLNYNVIVGNTSTGAPPSSGLRNNTGVVDANNNWWGCDGGPALSPCDRASGAGAGITAWLQLSHTATPNSIGTGQTATLQADFFTNSGNAAISPSNLVALNGRAVTFNNAVNGSISGADATINAGKANATFTAGNTGGNGSADATVDSETETASISITEAPEITCPANIVTNNDPGTCNASVSFAATATGVPAPTITYKIGNTTITSPHVFSPGTTTVTATASNGTVDDTCQFTVTVNDPAPTISCPANITTPAPEGTCGAVVNYTPPVGADNCPGANTVQTAGLPSGSTFPVGVTTNSFTVTDASGQQASCSFTVTVTDNQAPTITLNGQTPVLWPPDHGYRTINVTDLVASASDLCDASVDINDVVIAQVSSDEAEDGPGDGSTFNDIVIAPDCKSVQLRAERQNLGNGRVYTITFKVKDAGGNVATVTATVIVPATSQNSGAIQGPGPGYTVNGCPP